MLSASNGSGVWRGGGGGGARHDLPLVVTLGSRNTLVVTLVTLVVTLVTLRGHASPIQAESSVYTRLKDNMRPLT